MFSLAFLYCSLLFFRLEMIVLLFLVCNCDSGTDARALEKLVPKVSLNVGDIASYIAFADFLTPFA